MGELNLSGLGEIFMIHVSPICFICFFSGDLKQKIVNALLNMNKSVEWNAELAKYNVWGFKPGSVDVYDEEKEIKDMVKGLSVRAIYY